ncbi:MAG TPA: prepilin-type N-terminal cleavage/methylation domain-containing protein [Burkholderiales bacterium]|nr:prepilin-type N-terminal cleavage/methylation domain-containing protein [Burkholderiales bacterium]
MNAPALRNRRVCVVASHDCRGVSLVELIVFIVITAVVVVGLVAGMSGAVRTAPVPKAMHQGLQLAQGRMELILAQRTRLDFAGFTSATFDPCAPPGGAQEACLAPAAFTVVAPCFYTGAGTCGFGAANTCRGGDVNYKCVRVRVTGPQGTTVAELEAMVANY